MLTRRSTIISIATALAGLPALSTQLVAQATSTPVKIVFPFAAGGGGDALSRLVAERLAPALNRSVIVENRTGADGRIGIQSVKAAAPDGDTLLLTTGPTMWLMALVHKAPGYDPFKDFEPVSHLAAFEFCIAVANTTGLTSVKALADWARANPDKATYGLPGVGTIPHFTGVAFSMLIGVDMRRLPYRGGALAMNDLVAGQIPISIGTVADALQQHRAGTIRILATTSKTRSPFLPDVPTLAEAGGPATGVPAGGHYMFAPAKTPPATLARIESEVRRAIASSEVRERFLNISLAPIGNSSAEFRQFFANAVKRYAEAARAAGIEPE